MQVGLVGTGYAAKQRAEALQVDSRSHLVAIAGQSSERTQAFAQPYGAIAVSDWQALIDQTDLDLIVIATINRDHAEIAHAALQSGKHVIVEYPLALDVAAATALVSLAHTQQKLLHVEHIELLGGVHQALRSSLPLVGEVFHARYVTLKSDRPAPQRWTYHPEQFGFPLMGALSRLHRLVDLFGEVERVSCQVRYWGVGSGEWAAAHGGSRTGVGRDASSPQPSSSTAYYSTCLCTAHLHFKTGVMAEVTYGKGEALWRSDRTFEVHGQQGGLIFEGESGTFISSEESRSIDVGSRRGLFAKDTTRVLDYLTTGTPLYISPEASLYTLKVADAARRSAEAGRVIELVA